MEESQSCNFSLICDFFDNPTATQLLEIPNEELFQPTDSEKNKRFDTEIKSEEAFHEALLDRIPSNTKRSTSLAINTFNSWKTWRELRAETWADKNYPIPSFAPEWTQSMDYEKWDYWLAR